jgi:hypothetical protein
MGNIDLLNDLNARDSLDMKGILTPYENETTNRGPATPPGLAVSQKQLKIKSHFLKGRQFMGRASVNLTRLQNIENKVVVRKTFLPKINKS